MKRVSSLEKYLLKNSNERQIRSKNYTHIYIYIHIKKSRINKVSTINPPYYPAYISCRLYLKEMNIDLAKFADLVMRGMACVIGGGVISGGNRCQVLDG